MASFRERALLFALTVLMQKHRESQKELHRVFVDLVCGGDGQVHKVRQESLWTIMFADDIVNYRESREQV